MTQKVATERRIKLRQETTSLGQIATVTVKLRISDKEQWFGLFITSLNAVKKVVFVNFPCASEKVSWQ